MHGYNPIKLSATGNTMLSVPDESVHDACLYTNDRVHRGGHEGSTDNSAQEAGTSTLEVHCKCGRGGCVGCKGLCGCLND